jgi:MoxR-like ATPase
MRFEGTSTYVATDDLTLAVSAAMTLERPLLVKGEPGAVKTMPAEKVAQGLVDWLKLLMAEDIPAEAPQSKDGKAVIPPLHGALLKNEQGAHLFERLIFMAHQNR